MKTAYVMSVGTRGALYLTVLLACTDDIDLRSSRRPLMTFDEACRRIGKAVCDPLRTNTELHAEVSLIGKFIEWCDTGSFAPACLVAGTVFSEGRVIDRDLSRGSSYLVHACVRGSGEGCLRLGRLYETGQLPGGQSSAGYYFNRACGLGATGGCPDGGARRIAEVPAPLPVERPDSGAVIEPPDAGAMLLCVPDNANGCNELARRFLHGDGLPKIESRAAFYYEQACRFGSAAGCDDYGWMFQQGIGVTKNARLALHYYKRACKGGRANGCNNEGVLREKGLGTRKNVARAVRLYDGACDGGIAYGCSNLGYFYLDGVAVTKDREHARALFAKACSLGNRTACEKQEELSKRRR